MVSFADYKRILQWERYISVSHMLQGLFDNNIWSWFEVELWRVPHVGQEMQTLSGTPDLTPTGVHIHFLPWVRIYGCWFWFVCLAESGFVVLTYCYYIPWIRDRCDQKSLWRMHHTNLITNSIRITKLMKVAAEVKSLIILYHCSHSHFGKKTIFVTVQTLYRCLICFSLHNYVHMVMHWYICFWTFAYNVIYVKYVLVYKYWLVIFIDSKGQMHIWLSW